MATFICRLSGEDMESVADRRFPREVSFCCLIHAESPEQIDEPLRDVVRRLRASPSAALDDVREMYLDDIIELADKPGSAVLWVTSAQPGKAPGTVIHLHLPLPIDDSGSMNAYGHGSDPAEQTARTSRPNRSSCSNRRRPPRGRTLKAEAKALRPAMPLQRVASRHARPAETRGSRRLRDSRAHRLPRWMRVRTPAARECYLFMSSAWKCSVGR